ncbi:MAG TPA: polymer-forming cytoskeletal protein [Candidatus Cybelea sp.]|nr:polymer-forming cytoskeletal protein [Candidatus Cybelea sp.]
MNLKGITSKLGTTTPADSGANSPAPPAVQTEGTTMTETDKQKSGFRPTIAKRGVDLPAAPRIENTLYDPKTLIVGREITLSGEITSCERLLVEGRVEAAMSDCRIIEIAESGLFKGAAEIQEADVRGCFEGKLTVRGRLMIRATGKVTGEIRYGDIEIERGGKILGQIGSAGEPASATTSLASGHATGFAAAD